jgi:8-oxo-dGTP pyrophosphatase MutT (NUDIX family)
VPATHEVAIIVLRDGDGSYFLHQRRPDKSTFPSRWGVGAGGAVEEGEEPWDAAQRELWEETGCAPALRHCFFLHHVDDEVNSRMHVFEATVNREDVGFDESEWSDSNWFTQDQLIDLAKRDDTLCPDTAAFVRKYLKITELPAAG